MSGDLRVEVNESSPELAVKSAMAGLEKECDLYMDGADKPGDLEAVAGDDIPVRAPNVRLKEAFRNLESQLTEVLSDTLHVPHAANDLSTENAVLAENLRLAEDENTTLKADLQSALKTISQMQCGVEDVDTDVIDEADIESIYAWAEEEFQRLEAVAARKQARLSSQVDTLSKKLRNLSAAHASDLSRLNSDNDALETEVATLKSEVRELTSDKNKLVAILEDIKLEANRKSSGIREVPFEGPRVINKTKLGSKAILEDVTRFSTVN